MSRDRDFIVDRLTRLTGPSRPDGRLPPGGNPGQVPIKLDFRDYNVGWSDAPASSSRGSSIELDGGDASGSDGSIIIDAGGAA